MKGYYRKIFLYIGCALAVAALFAAMNSGVFVEGSGYTLSLSNQQEPVDTVDQEKLEAGRLQALVLWDKESEVSEKYAGNLERVLGQMEFSWELLDIRQKDAVSYTDYDLVIVAFDDWDGLIGEDSRRLLRYVEQGGRLFLGMASSTVDKVLPVWYRAMGITEYGEFVGIEGIFFDQELLAGSQGRSFVDESFSDSALGVQLSNSQYLLASGVIGDRKTPLIWKAPYSPNEFLSSDAFLDVVMEACEETYRLTPFNEVFWTIRSMLLPVLNILRCPVPEADVFHTVSTGYAGILGAMFQYRTGKPFIVTEHGIYSREREEEILKASWVDVYFKQTWINFFLGMASAAYGHASRVVSLFHHARELQIGYGADPARCQVIPNGISLERFAHIPPLGLEDRPLRLGAVIRVVPIKDLKTMIYAFAQVRRAEPEAELTLIGPTDEDPECFSECEELIHSLGVEGISFVGRVDVAQWYGRLDLVLLSSVSEGQPFVVLEAMASRRPLVTTDVGSCRELLEGNGDGMGPAGEVVPVMNPQLMARTILRLGRDRELLRAMGENGWARADRFYRQEDFLKAYEKLYQEVTGHGGRGV